MFKRILYWILPVLLLPFIISSCNDGIEEYAEIRAISFGYDADNEYSSRFQDERFSDKMFTAFNAQSVIDAALENQELAGHQTVSSEPSRFNYKSEATLKLKTVPENAKIKSVKVTSSDTDIMEVTSINGRDVHVLVHDVGETTLSVTVEGTMNTVKEDYPIRVVSPIEVDFYISPYWSGIINTRLRMRARSLPLGLKSCASTFQDSVTVIGYCEYYDVYNHGRIPQVKRDTITFSMQEHKCLIKKKSKRFIRNITSAVRDIRSQSVEGSRIIQVSSVKNDTVSYRYNFVVEQVILDFNIFGANPYYEYYFSTKCDRTTDVLVIDEKTGEPTGEIFDGGSDDEEDFDESSDGVELKREESAYFVIRYNDFLSQAERDSLSLAFKKELDDIGYDDSKLSDDKKEKQLEELDKYK